MSRLAAPAASLFAKSTAPALRALLRPLSVLIATVILLVLVVIPDRPAAA